jgi:hypothetical protein
MKNLLKIGLMATSISVFASGCSGCGDRAKPAHEKIDTGKMPPDSSKKTVDSPKVKIDTVKKDTTKKK